MLDRNTRIYFLIAAVLMGAYQPLNAFWWLFNDWSRDQKLYNAYQKKDYTAIKKHLTQELIEKPYDPELNYKVGDAQSHLKEYDAAHASFKRVSERCSDRQKNLKERALTRQACASCNKAQASLGKDWKTKKVDEKIIDAAIVLLEQGIAEYDSVLALNPAAELAKKGKARAEALIKELREKKEEQQNNDQDNNQDQDEQDKKDQQDKQDKDQKKDSKNKQSSDKKDQQEQSSDDKKQDDSKDKGKQEGKDKKETKDDAGKKDTDKEKSGKDKSSESDKKRDQGKEEKDERSGDDEKPENPDQEKPNKESGSSEDKKDDSETKDQGASAAGDKDEERSAAEGAAGEGTEKEGEEEAGKAAQEAQHEDTAQALQNKGMVALLKSLDKDEAKLQKRRIMIQTRGDQRNSARGQKPW